MTDPAAPPGQMTDPAAPPGQMADPAAPAGQMADPAAPVGQPCPGHLDPGRSDPGQPRPGHLDPGRSDPGQPRPGHLDPGQPGPGQRWLDPGEMAAWLAFLEVSHRLDRVIEQQLRRDAGLSHAQYEVLSRLESAPGGQLRMSDLAEVIIVSRSGLTYQVTQLEKAGLVRRAKDPSDDRGVLAILTPDGRAALVRAAPGHLRVVRDNLIDTLTPAQLTAVTEALTAARTRLRPPT